MRQDNKMDDLGPNVLSHPFPYLSGLGPRAQGPPLDPVGLLHHPYLNAYLILGWSQPLENKVLGFLIFHTHWQGRYWRCPG